MFFIDLFSNKLLVSIGIINVLLIQKQNIYKIIIAALKKSKYFL